MDINISLTFDSVKIWPISWFPWDLTRNKQGPASCKSIKTSNFSEVFEISAALEKIKSTDWIPKVNSDGNLNPRDKDKQGDNKEGFYDVAIEIIYVLEVIGDKALTTSTVGCIILNDDENEADDLSIDHPRSA
ncbi:hypothetical protein V6N12_028440 [Hibiscus sabdariffa]|uniref:Uncharacterized protein n=1 Tax=Hibiscus sabdariffa TaxID=183260 RepID=A0ABR2F5U4_9ROSI